MVGEEAMLEMLGKWPILRVMGEPVGNHRLHPEGSEIRGGGSVAPGRYSRPEIASPLLALTGKVGLEFGTAVRVGTPDWPGSGKPVVSQ